MLKLVTGSDKAYYSRHVPYLDTLRALTDFPVHYIGVGWNPGTIDGIKTATLSDAKNDGAPSQTRCIQHGSFLPVVPARANTVLLYTDGDFTMQRALDDGEKALLDLEHGQAVTSWNGGPHETLAHEADRLGMKQHKHAIEAEWGHFDRAIYNVGFLAMTKKTWQQVYAHYMARWQKIGEYFDHAARQQWLISWTLADLSIDVKVAPWSLHAHGHFGLKPGMTRGPGGVLVDGKLAAFRHYL